MRDVWGIFMKRWTQIVLLCVTCVILVGCSKSGYEVFEGTPATVDELYRSGERSIFVEEMDGLQEYEIVDRNYNGNMLLMRHFVLPETVRFSDYPAYYGSSELDAYLNNEYLSMLSDTVTPWIVVMDVEIAHEDAIDVVGEEIEVIPRKAFVLSANELGWDLDIAAKEGRLLDYFDEDYTRRRTKSSESGSDMGYWTRSANLSAYSLVFVIGTGGQLDYANAYGSHPVRPCFCVSRDTPMYVSNGVYILGEMDN